MQKVLIVASQNKVDLSHFDDYFIVGIERGCLDLISKNMRIDLAISDFDHVNENEFKNIEKYAKMLIKLDSTKDFLDGVSAYEYAKRIGYTDFTFIVNPSNRNDLNLSVINLLMNNIKIISDDSIMFLLEQGIHNLDYGQYKKYQYVSFLIPYKNTVLTFKKLAYEIENTKVDQWTTLTYSNNLLENQNPYIKCNQDIIVIFNKKSKY